MHWWRVLLRATCSIGIALACGCGREEATTYPVHGRVVFKDGEPVPRGRIEFAAVDQPFSATSEISPDGTFELGTYRRGDGAIPGRHRAVVIADTDITTGLERPGELPPPLVDLKYSRFETSGLEFEVKAPMNNFLIELERGKPAKP